MINAGAFARWLCAAKDDVSSQASGGEMSPAPRGSPLAPESPFWEHPGLAGSSWHRGAGHCSGRGGSLSFTSALPQGQGRSPAAAGREDELLCHVQAPR